MIDSTYDPTSGRLTSTTTPRGIYTPSYDAASGNLTSIAGPGGTGLAFAYDGSLPLSVTWSGEVAGSVSATYNNRFEVTERKINGGHAVSYSTNNDGQLTQAGPLALSYNATTGFPTGSAVLGSSDALTFSNFGELATYTATQDGSTLYQTTFTRDRGGRITEKVEVIAGTTDTYTYAYDGAGRLVEVVKNGSIFEHYDYDGNSNRTTWTDPWGSHTATVDDQDRLLATDTAAYTYNANGELQTKSAGGNTVSYEYDVSGQLLGVDLPSGIAIDYVLDASNRRVGKKINGTLVQGWLYGGASPVAELDGAGNVVATFVYARKGHVPELMVKEGETYRLITDHLGSVRLVVNTSTGAVAQRLDYSAFGRVMLDSNPGFQPFGYAGGLFDTQTGLVRFGARDYDPEVGRWTARDPIGFSGGDTNLFGYVLQDPVNLNDPSGLTAEDFVAGFLEGAAVGLVAGVAAAGLVFVAPAAAPFLLVAGIIGLATAAVDGYYLFTDPCADSRDQHYFAGAAVGGLLGGKAGYKAGGRFAGASRASARAPASEGGNFGPNTVGAAQRGGLPTSFTRQMGSQAEKIAEGREIHKVDQLVEMFGGRANNWRKMKTWNESGQEIHYYEHHGIGRVGLKWAGERDPF